MLADLAALKAQLAELAALKAQLAELAALKGLRRCWQSWRRSRDCGGAGRAGGAQGIAEVLAELAVLKGLRRCWQSWRRSRLSWRS